MWLDTVISNSFFPILNSKSFQLSVICQYDGTLFMRVQNEKKKKNMQKNETTLPKKKKKNIQLILNMLVDYNSIYCAYFVYFHFDSLANLLI